MDFFYQKRAALSAFGLTLLMSPIILLFSALYGATQRVWSTTLPILFLLLLFPLLQILNPIYILVAALTIIGLALAVGLYKIGSVAKAIPLLSMLPDLSHFTMTKRLHICLCVASLLLCSILILCIPLPLYLTLSHIVLAGLTTIATLYCFQKYFRHCYRTFLGHMNAKLLRHDLSSVKAVTKTKGYGDNKDAMEVSYNTMIEKLTQDQYIWIQEELEQRGWKGPISLEVLIDPVYIEQHSKKTYFERAKLIEWLEDHNTNPYTNEPINGAKIETAEEIKILIEAHRRQLMSWLRAHGAHIDTTNREEFIKAVFPQQSVVMKS